jgi:protein required for attachment to host cells
MARTWFIIANASRARICEWSEGRNHLLELADFIHPQSRGMGSDLDRDRAGHVQRSLGDGGLGGVALTPHTDPRHKEHAVFARQLAAHVEAALIAHRCDALCLVASNPFLGELKSHLHAAGKMALRSTVPSDLSELALPELAKHLNALEL